MGFWASNFKKCIISDIETVETEDIKEKTEHGTKTETIRKPQVCLIGGGETEKINQKQRIW